MAILRRRASSARRRYDNVDQLLEDYELPSFPGAAAEALALLSDPESDLSEVARVISLDPGTAVALLRLVNSAAAGLGRVVGNLHQAVALLGRNQVESLLISRAVGSVLPEPESGSFDKRRFWLASAQRATIASALAELTNPSRRSEVFTAALLQDMAMPVMVERLDGYEQLHAEWIEGSIALLDQEENERFGRSHADVGAWMCQKWELPPDLTALIDDHHHDTKEEHSTAYVVAGWDLAGGVDLRAQLIDRAGHVDSIDEATVGAAVDSGLRDAQSIAELFC